MRPTAEGMSHFIPTHVLRVGQTIQLDSTKHETRTNHLPNLATSSVKQDDNELDISLANLNQLILELDPTLEPHITIATPTDIVTSPVLISRGCGSPVARKSVSPSIPIPSQSCSPHGALAFSGSPSFSLPPLPCGSVVRRSPLLKQDGGSSQGSLRLSHSNRNSAVSLLSTSSCSDTSYILGSTLSLTSEDADSSDFRFNITGTSGSFSDVSRTKLGDTGLISDNKPLSPKNKHLQGLHNKGVHSSPASLAGSLTEIPLLLVNGAPQTDLQICPPSPGLQYPSKPCSPLSFRFNGNQTSMRGVMDTSKFWFRPHISRAEAEAIVKDNEPGTFVIRDSTSYKGSFGLAMKVDQSPTTFALTANPGDNSTDQVRHFLIESSAKGVRIKGSSQEPYFGSLPALVYQHTISAYALPGKLVLSSQDTTEENYSKPKEDKHKTASNFIYLNTVPTEMLTGPCAVQKAVSITFDKAPGSFTPTIVNMKVSSKGVTLTDINRKLFFRRHYPTHLLSYSGEDPENRQWVRGLSFRAKMFGFVAKGVEAGMENVCHIFAEYDPLQPCNKIIEFIQATIT